MGTEKHYRLTLTETQLKVLKEVCEFRFRIDLMQGGDLTEVLAQLNTDLSPENPNRKRIFDSYIDRRNAIHEIVDAIFRISVPFRNQTYKRNKTALISEDLWQAIRYTLWQNNPDREMLGFTVDSRPPLRVSDQPLPTIERID